MLNFNQSKKLLAIVGCALAGFLSFSSAYALNPEPVTAEVTFVTPITISTNNQLQYGFLDVGLVPGETIIIAPDSTLSGTGLARIAGGAQAAANLSVTATTGQPITILIQNLSFGAGYQLNTFLCTYDTDVNAPCDGGGLLTNSSALATDTLTVGATLVGFGVPVLGNQDGSFEVSVLYQ
jgi:hypothetical protein